MYWFFSAPGWNLAIWVVSILLIGSGGWLLASHLFALETRERVLAGFAIGLVLYLWLLNWIGRWLPAFWAYLGGACIVLVLGVASAYPFRERWLSARDWKIGWWLAAGAALGWVFLRISKGTGLFDEYKNLALISTLANGQIPAHEYFGLPSLLRYHYGFHFLGAGMMQLGHFMPWSAFDLSKSIVWSLSLLLAALVGVRYLGGMRGGLLLAAAVALSGGTRYLLLLLPSGWLFSIQQHVTLTGIASGALIPALSSVLPMEASPQIGYPFAFLSGINPSYMMAHGGEQTIEPLLFMLGLLLIGRAEKRISAAFFAVFFSFWALASETSLALFALGWMLMLAWRFSRSRRALAADPTFVLPTLGLAVALPLILVQGGTLTAMIQHAGASAAQAAAQGAAQATPGAPGLLGFSLRWPPAIISGQLGQLPLGDPLGALAGIFEMGVVVLALPWLTYIWWRGDHKDWRLQLMLGISWCGLLIPLFLRWKPEAEISHITDFAVDVCMVLLVFVLARPPSLAGGAWRGLRVFGALCLVLTCVPGTVLLGVQLTAAQDTVLSAHYDDAEARLVQQAWGKLPHSSKVLGAVGNSSILTGQLTAGVYALPPGTERSIWEAMLTKPRLQTLVQNHFDFVFADSRWWRSLDVASQQQLEAPCIRLFARGEDASGGGFAELLDLRACR